MTKLKITALFIFYILAVVGTVKNTNAQALDFNWSAMIYHNSNGTDGNVYSSVSYNGSLIVAGGFSRACGIDARNIVLWNGTIWAPLGGGVGTGTGDTVYALSVYNGQLYAAGHFSSAGGMSANNIARWDGTGWHAVGTGTDSTIKTLFVFNNELAVGGEFTSAGGQPNTRGIARFNGTNWSAYGQGFPFAGDKVFALTSFQNQLIAAGRIHQPVGNIAAWNGSAWVSLSSNTNADIFALTVHNSQLYAGGKFTVISGMSYSHVAGWNGTTWFSLNGGVSDDVNALVSFSGNLIAGGSFKYANGGSLYVDRISQYSGVVWSRMITGMSSKVNSLFVGTFWPDTILYAGGDFFSAGGKYAYTVAQWRLEQTSIVSGQVRYSDNNAPVMNGRVKIIRRDVNTQEVIVIDSTTISNGVYALPKVRRDSADRVIIFPEDETDFVPTYYPSTINWRDAVPVNPMNNLVNIDVQVFRITHDQNQVTVNVGGYVYLNFTPPIDQPGNFPYNSDGIVYFKQGNLFKRFSVSNTTQQYSISNIDTGTYDVTVYRLGYSSASRTVRVGSVNLDTLNFYLDTSNVIGIRNISSQVPAEFGLSQNYPNPFNPSTKIKFLIAKGSLTELKIFDILGREVAVLANEFLKPGFYEVTFSANNLPSGIYFYRLVTGKFTETKKMILIK